MPTARQTPVGQKLNDGYQSLLTFAADPDVSFWEKTIKPPGLDGGEPIPTTTMFNTLYRTFSPRSLITLTQTTLTAAYDPAVLDQIANLLNVNTMLTLLFPNGDKWDFWGFLQLFDPQQLQEGTQPEANITIGVTNENNAGAEVAPNFISAAGTD